MARRVHCSKTAASNFRAIEVLCETRSNGENCMIGGDFLKAGHTPTLFAAFFYFDMSFMVWVLLGPLGVQASKTLGLVPAQTGFMVAVPLLSGALLRVVNGVLVDRVGPKT